MISCERKVVICKCWLAESKNKVCRTNVILKFHHLIENKNNPVLYILLTQDLNIYRKTLRKI